MLISEVIDQRSRGTLALIREIRNIRPDLKTIVLTDSPTRENVVAAFRAGAKGVFCRNRSVKILCRCISAVYEGQVWASSAELGFVLDALTATPNVKVRDDGSLDALSSRELEVIACLAEGLHNREIAERLAITAHTVKNYMFRIFEKLGVSNRVELVSFILSKADYERAQPPQSKSNITAFKMSA
jgi:DNA-binding NarL/FixJ family response regulator